MSSGGFLGAAIGGVIGFSTTDDEVVYEYVNPETYDFNKLNVYARYGGNEPEYLKKKKMITIKNIALFFLCVISMSGCFSSTSIYKNEYEANDSTFVKRDEGADVYITMESGKNYSGELLVINVSLMFVSNDFGLSDEELADSANQIYIIQNDSIKSIWIQGSSNLLIGLGVGIVVSILIIEAAGPKRRRFLG